MAVINHALREINLKIVYCGPGLSGKTTNLKWLNRNLGDSKVGKLVSLATESDRTLFFDLMPVNLGKIRGFNVRIQLFTTPGQVFYNATRKLVLKGVDGLVFVADSQELMEDANIESLENVKENLAENNRSLDSLPFIFQYNKRDIEHTLPIETLEETLNPEGLPYFEASALSGKGIKETFLHISKLTFQSLQNLPAEEKDKRATVVAPTPTPAKVTPARETTQIPNQRRDLEVEGELQVKTCLQPTVQSDGSVEIPLILVDSNSGREVRLTLELGIKSSSLAGTTKLVVHSKKI